MSDNSGIGRIEVTFQDEKDSSIKTVRVPLGTSLLEAAHENHIDLEGEHFDVNGSMIVRHRYRGVPICNMCISRWASVDLQNFFVWTLPELKRFAHL